MNRTNDPKGEESVNEHSYRAWLVAPRVGYALMRNDSFGVWPRAGVNYWHASRKAQLEYPNNLDASEREYDRASTGHGFDVGFEVNLTVTPVRHMMVLFGATLDLPLTSSGTVRHNTYSDDESLCTTTVGLQAAVGAWF